MLTQTALEPNFFSEDVARYLDFEGGCCRINADYGCKTAHIMWNNHTANAQRAEAVNAEILANVDGITSIRHDNSPKGETAHEWNEGDRVPTIFKTLEPTVAEEPTTTANNEAGLTDAEAEKTTHEASKEPEVNLTRALKDNNAVQSTEQESNRGIDI